MSRFKRASHVIWHFQYHIVWVPKYRFRVLQGPVGTEAGLRSCRTQCSAGPCAFFGEHSVEAVGIRIDGRPEMTYRYTNFYGLSIFEEKPYHFWEKGYCVDSVGLNSEMIQKYVRF
jgi:putative transposase